MKRLIVTITTITVTLIALAVPAHAEPKLAGMNTVGEFRTWSTSAQFGFVSGWSTYMRWLNVACARPITMGEKVAALKYSFAETELLSTALALLEIRGGCRAEPAPNHVTPPKPGDDDAA